MFTGLIQGMGRITEAAPHGGEYKLSVAPDFDWDDSLQIGESISVSGACLTVTEINGQAFSAHVSAETINRTAFKGIRPGLKVNLERALKLSDRLGGHLVSGHVDGVGLIRDLRPRDQSLIFIIGLERALVKHMIEKGSVTVDGISLTINQVWDDAFSVNVIPHTAQATTLSGKRTGESVNIETDMIGKYVARLLGRSQGDSKLDMNFLAEHGFL